MKDLTTATPVEIDTRLAALYREAGSAEAKVLAAAVSIHWALGEKPEHVTRTRKTWPTTDADAVAAARARGDERIPRSGGGYTYADMVAKYDAAAAALEAIKAEATPLNDEYDRRPWSRFFTVQNTGGHIHASMICSTCNRGVYATQFGWNPELSGLSEADAVAKLGPALCTVCFPSAPVEWTVGADKKANQCDGSRKLPIEGTVKKTGMRRYGDCTKCTDRPMINGDGTVRAHKPKEPREQATPETPVAEVTPVADEPAATTVEQPAPPQCTGPEDLDAAVEGFQAAAARAAAREVETMRQALTDAGVNVRTLTDDQVRAAYASRTTNRVADVDGRMFGPGALVETCGPGSLWVGEKARAVAVGNDAQGGGQWVQLEWVERQGGMARSANRVRLVEDSGQGSVPAATPDELDEAEERRAVAGRMFARGEGMTDAAGECTLYRMVRARVGARLVRIHGAGGELLGTVAEQGEGFRAETAAGAELPARPGGLFGGFADAVAAVRAAAGSVQDDDQVAGEATVAEETAAEMTDSTERTDPVVVTFYLGSSYSDAEYSETLKVDRARWVSMSPADRRCMLDQHLETLVDNKTDSGWSIEDQEDQASTEGERDAAAPAGDRLMTLADERRMPTYGLGYDDHLLSSMAADKAGAARIGTDAEGEPVLTVLTDEGLGRAFSPSDVAAALQRAIAQGRDDRLALPPVVPGRQYATVAELEAALRALVAEHGIEPGTLRRVADQVERDRDNSGE